MSTDRGVIVRSSLLCSTTQWAVMDEFERLLSMRWAFASLQGEIAVRSCALRVTSVSDANRQPPRAHAWNWQLDIDIFIYSLIEQSYLNDPEPHRLHMCMYLGSCRYSLFSRS